MINFPDIHEEWYEFYDPHGNYIDRIEDYIQWLEIRVQIREKKLKGYYIIDKRGVKARIDSKGSCEWDILNPFSIVSDLLDKLFD